SRVSCRRVGDWPVSAAPRREGPPTERRWDIASWGGGEHVACQRRGGIGAIRRAPPAAVMCGRRNPCVHYGRAEAGRPCATSTEQGARFNIDSATLPSKRRR